MMGGITGVPDTIIELALTALAVALVLAFVRLVRGPSLMDRVTSLELIASLVALSCEALMLSIRKRPLQPFLTDYSALVTACLLALALPQLALHNDNHA